MALERAKSVIEMVKLSEWNSIPVSKYSYGMNKRLALARALVSDPDILILDEPTAGVDPESRYLIRNIMKKLADQDKTIFFSSHDLEEVQKVCTHVALLKKGKLISQGALNKVISEFGKSRTFARLKSPADAEYLAKKIQNIAYDITVEGPLISFYPGDDFVILELKENNILDTWDVKSSLEDVYLDLVARKEAET
ncbi:MAG: ABC transporter ATP-binding protein [Methanobacterium paludis]|nr:ABC transporter ATP-binding protein [Methanobacterium paludis]